MKAILVVFVSLIIINSCGNSPTENKPNYKDPRDMSWESDTINYPGSGQTWMSSIWASSPKDVWIAGHNDRSKGDLWHYAGNKWFEVDISKDIERSAKSISKISGTSPSNIWIAGTRDFSDPTNPSNRWFEDLIVQYDGVKWKEHKQNSKSGMLGLNCDNANNIWACGDSGRVFNFNGNVWKADQIKIPFLPGAFYTLVSISVYNNKTFVLASIFDSKRGKESYYFVNGQIGNWTVIDSMILSGPSSKIKWGNWGLYKSSYNKLYSYGPGGIWEWNGNEWLNIFNLNLPIRGMFALRQDYMIAVGDFGKVYFYDGINWTQISKLEDSLSFLNYTDAWTNGTELFVLGHTFYGWPQKTVVWKGK